MKVLPFEEKKFCQLRTLAQRWDCSVERIYDLASKGLLRLWHPEGKTNSKGRRVEIASALRLEERGFLETGLAELDDED